MRKIINWFSGARPPAESKKIETSSEWMALEAAMLSHDFNALTGSIRAWSMLPTSALEQLQKLAARASFSTIELNKVEILFEYYARNVAVAFTKAQEHMANHGFDADLHVIILASLYQNHQFEDAHIYQRSLNPSEAATMNRADYWQMVAVIRWAVNDMRNLAPAIDRALALAPDDGALLQTALGMYVELGIDEKVTALREKLAIRADAHGYAYSLCLLALGDSAAGWHHMETRYEMEESHRYLNQALKSKPRWQGGTLSGVRLMLSAEQGLGDTIQMVRYFPLLQSCCPQKLMLETQPETLTLLQYNFPTIPMVERRLTQTAEQDFDAWVGLMSLPLLLNAWGERTPGREGYLRVPPENTEYWKERIDQVSPGRKPKIGLAWSGQPNHRADRRRSVPFELIMRQVRGVSAGFFALQTQVPSALPANVMNVSEELITLADTAALIEQMDLVITVDTSIVHIAGALGKETWLLLPKRYEWRWGLEGEKNDWYDSVKVIRQTEHGNWNAVLQDVFENRLPKRFNF